MKNSAHTNEVAYGILGLIIILLMVAVSVLLVTPAHTPEEVIYTNDGNMLAIENTLDYCLAAVPADNVDIIVSQ